MKNLKIKLLHFVRSKKGFTLVEMVVVMMILGVVVAITLPNYSRPFSDYKLYTAARQMQVEIRSLQQKSMALDNTILTNSMQFGQGINTYTITEVISVSPGKVQYRPPRMIKLPEGISILATSLNNNQLNISKNGSVSTGGTITLSSAVTGKRLYVIVATGAGRVRLSNLLPKSQDS
ncbi:type II secretion system protein [Desulforamulus aeronauticus]|uniref:Type IV pilin N-term methylation site GFxxxE n=1 Tax=Desulforamulus aeronauticus DSM 10349 TaxID=1121421 RepID=A0A1M6PHU0_9FIRM|nr:type II secretion system protein [Desulforamulus aeronauticus]SHK07515.1 Type IV pilin N-term methylation site GFxxxE [Desulforamulus aeronauticus DSM 10349]